MNPTSARILCTILTWQLSDTITRQTLNIGSTSWVAATTYAPLSQLVLAYFTFLLIASLVFVRPTFEFTSTHVVVMSSNGAGNTAAIGTTEQQLESGTQMVATEDKLESSLHKHINSTNNSPNSHIETMSKSPKTRARKHEIDFLVTEDDEQPSKRARFLSDKAQFISSPVTPPYPFTSQKRITLPILSNYDTVLSLPSIRSMNNVGVQPPQPTMIRCSECTFISPHSSAVIAHARISHPRKPYACGICGRCFGEKGNMNKHHRTVHLRQRKHSCSQCGRTFAFLDGLNRHISMVHLDRRPFECTFCLCPLPHSPSTPCSHICGMRFKQKSHHRRHLSSVHQIDLPISP